MKDSFSLKLIFSIAICLTVISEGSTTTTYLYDGVCKTSESTICTVTTLSESTPKKCYRTFSGTFDRTRKLTSSYGEPDGYCECLANNKQTCYDTSDTDNFGCITPVDGKLSHGDAAYCESLCRSNHCKAGNYVCYSTSDGLNLQSDGSGNCQCDNSYDCYQDGDIDSPPACSPPGTTYISQNDHVNCYAVSTNSCDDSDKCWMKDRNGNNVCRSLAASPNVNDGISHGGPCTCRDERHCLIFGASLSNLQCVESTYILDNNLVSRWSKNEYCRDPLESDSMLCANDDQCWHPVNRVCTPFNAYGHSKGECKMSQYVLVLNNQIVDESYDGEFHPVFIVNSFNDIYSQLQLNGLADLTSTIIDYYNDNYAWPDVPQGQYLFAHAKKTFTAGNLNTKDTYEYWSFGGNVAHDKYQQEQIKSGRYLWDWEAKESQAGSNGLFMVFWAPEDVAIYDGNYECYQYNGDNSKKNDLKPIFLKMRYFYKENTAVNFLKQIKNENRYAALLIKKSFDGAPDLEYKNDYFGQDDCNEFYISIREILMGFYSPRCILRPPAPEPEPVQA